MTLHELRLQSFRAHRDTRVTFSPKINLLYGPNGAGKTNILEALHYLCLSKSFLSVRDKYVLQQDRPYFEVEGVFTGVRRSETVVRLAYVPDEGKKIFVNDAPLDRLTEIVGMLPIVVFSPEDYVITAEGPSERRRFLNNILSQARPVYMDDLMKYRRARKQRNELLRQYKNKRQPPPESAMKPWTEELVKLGARVIKARHAFVNEFATYLERAYQEIEAVAERPTITYQAIGDFGAKPTTQEVEAAFHEALERTAEGEESRGTTLVGPQRDELVFKLGDLEVRRYASQGQHRTFGMALKLAKFFYLDDQSDKTPLLLLDDAFGKLDPERTEAFLELLKSDTIGQSLITDTRLSSFEGAVDFTAERHQALLVRDGSVERTSESAETPSTP